jgi:methyl-accepting chemotaxis protein
MTRGTMRLIGTGLIAYGLVGTILLGVIGIEVARPLDHLNAIGASLSDQRDAALESLERAAETIGQTADSVRNIDGSLVEAQQATQRASTISRGISLTMFNMAEQMQLTVFGVQPLITLYPGFEASGQQLELMAEDVERIAEALEANREDTVAIAAGLDELGASIERLTEAVAGGPELPDAAATIAPIQLGLLALIGWLLVAAIGSILAGMALWFASRSARYGSIDPSA